MLMRKVEKWVPAGFHTREFTRVLWWGMPLNGDGIDETHKV